MLKSSAAADTAFVQDRMQEVLYRPAAEFLGRPSKKFRSSLVHLGFKLASLRSSQAGANPELVALAAEAVESIHAGSLVIDDIQDQSATRRGAQTLHLQHGVPLALNVGNWLYFEPLRQVAEWKLSSQQELAVYRLCHTALALAHHGQALDVGTAMGEIPEARLGELCLASHRYKTGSLTRLAIGLGAILGGAETEWQAALEEFGERFGLALQRLDDLGNAASKRYEDFVLARPNWVWVVAAAEGREFLARFRGAVQALPDEAELHKILGEGDWILRARASAREHLASEIDWLFGQAGKVDSAVIQGELENLAEVLGKAYG